LDFWFENKPSGNPELKEKWSRQLFSTKPMSTVKGSESI
jgi:hypothetical protein